MKPLDVCEVVNEEDPGGKASEAGTAHVEDLGVTRHQVGDGGVRANAARARARTFAANEWPVNSQQSG